MLPTAGLKTRTLNIGTGNWRATTTAHTIYLSSQHQRYLRSTIALWSSINPHPEDTWVARNYGLPTLMLRFDCSIGSEGELFIYEVEERPQGIGSAFLYDHPYFLDRLAAAQASWPSFVSIETPRHLADGGTDDGVGWIPQIPLSRLAEVAPDTLLLVRSATGEEGLSELIPRSISTLTTEGQKRYGIDLGWWRLVNQSDDLPWDTSFVLKPVQGSKSHGITIYSANGRLRGSSTRSQVVSVLERYGSMYCQPYHPPTRIVYEGKPHHLLLRPFFFYDIRSQDWIYGGGEWLIDPNVKLHGTSGTIFGPLA